MKFIKDKHYHLIKMDNVFYLYDGEIGFEVNEIGARIFDLCNGKNNRKDIIKKLSIFYSVDQKEIENDIIQFINILEENKIILEVS